MSDLLSKSCTACEGKEAPLDVSACEALIIQTPKWQLDKNLSISRTFAFKDHYELMAFVNALAWISHKENHHPDLVLGYAQVQVTYQTHAVNGLTENDFICAKKANHLLDL